MYYGVLMPGVARTRFGLWSKMCGGNWSPIPATHAILSSTAQLALREKGMKILEMKKS